MRPLPQHTVTSSASLADARTAPRTPAVVFITALLLTIFCLPREAPAQAPTPSQYDVQAVYLFDFAKFVRWPSGTEHETLTICVAGAKAYTDTLTRIVAGEQIEGRPIAVRAIQNPEDVAGCNIVFIGVAARERLDSLLAATTGKPILTVSDVPGFLDRGGMIQFLVIANRVRFSVDLRPAARGGISLNSELLKVAVSVNGKPIGGGAQ